MMLKCSLTHAYSAHQFIHWLSLGVMTPALILVFQSRNLHLLDIGFIMGCWLSSTALLELPFGTLADNFGRIKTYIISLILTAIGLYLLVIAREFFAFIPAVIILGAARATYTGSLDAWFFDAFQLKKNTLSYHHATCIITLCSTAGFAIGALIGGAVPGHLQEIGLSEILYSPYDINILLSLLLTFVLFTFTLLFFFRIKISTKSLQAKYNLVNHSRHAIKFCFSDAVLKWLIFSTVLFGTAITAIETYWQPQLLDIINDKMSSAWAIGLISSLCSVVSGLSSILAMLILRKTPLNHIQLLISSRMISGVFLIAIATSSSFISFSFAYLFFMLLFSLGGCSINLLVLSATPANYRSTILSVFSLMGTAGAIVTSVLFGYIAENYGISITWVLCAILVAIASTSYLYIPNNESQQDQMMKLSHQS